MGLRRFTDDYKAAEQHHQQYQAETAGQLLSDILDASAVIDYVRERLSVIGSVKTGRAVIPGPFLASLIERDSEVAREVIKAVLADPTDLLGQVLGVALSQLALTAPTEAVEKPANLLTIDDDGLDRQIGHAFSLGLGARTDLHADEITLIESLAQHPDPDVRSVIVHAADNLAASSKARAVRLLLSIDFQDSTPVAASVLGEFNRHGFSVNDLGPGNGPTYSTAGGLPQLGRLRHRALPRRCRSRRCGEDGRHAPDSHRPPSGDESTGALRDCHGHGGTPASLP